MIRISTEHPFMYTVYLSLQIQEEPPENSPSVNTAARVFARAAARVLGNGRDILN